MVEKASNAFTLEKLRNLQWEKVFRMFYIEPVVFMLLFSHTLSGELPSPVPRCPSPPNPPARTYHQFGILFRHHPAQPGHLPDVHSDIPLQRERLQAAGCEKRQCGNQCGLQYGGSHQSTTEI